MLASPTVAVVIVNWNQEAETAACLTSLRATRGALLSLVLVDNGSAPESVDRLQRQFPEAQVLRLPENRGPVGARNVGIRHSLDAGATHILIVDNDTLFDPGFLPPLLEATQGPGVGVVGPKIYYHPDVSRIWFAGGRIDWSTGCHSHLGTDEVDQGQWDTPREIDYIPTCCLLASSRVFEDVGGMDERYFIYFDDTDWSLRARRHGYRCRYAPDSRIWHKVSRAMKTGSPVLDYYYARNRLLFFKSNAPPRHRLRLILLYTARSLRYAYTLRSQGLGQNAAAVAQGVRDFYRGRFGQCPSQFTTCASSPPA
jgi:GT2 family glycosyltransferase